MMNVKQNSFGHFLGEIGQSTNAKMALCRRTKNGFETCHEMVKCKDFMHDAMACMFISGRKSDIYGFQYDPNTMPRIPTDEIIVFVTGVKEVDAQNSLSVLNALEESAEFKKTTLTKVGCGFVFEGCGEWCLSPGAISLFTGMIRAGQYGGCDGTVGGLRKHFTKMATLHGNDPSYVKQAGASKAVDKMTKLMHDKSIRWDNFDYTAISSHALHHGCGWVAYCAGIYATSCGDSSFPVH